MLQGRTFSYSDTQRYRVGINYLQLPINAAKTHVATNQRDGNMTHHVDLVPGTNPHVNYEPSSLNGLKEAIIQHPDHEPFMQIRLSVREYRAQAFLSRREKDTGHLRTGKRTI